MSTALSKDDYLKATARLQPGFGPTQDFADPSVGTTVQTPGGVPPALDGLPGQVFAVEQLPNPAVALAAGFVPQQIPAHLIVEGDDVATHPQGPGFLERRGMEEQATLGYPTLAYDGTVMSAEDSLKAFGEITGENGTPPAGHAEVDNTDKNAPAAESAPSETAPVA